MTKYTRLTGKVFGSSATATGDDPEIGQFGSALAGTYNGTTDVSVIQSLPAWQKGFISAVTPNTQFPPLPEMTGFGKVLSQQICYLLQQGVPEYDNGTTYYDGNWCSYQKKLYFCKNDNDGAGISGFLPTNITYWSQFTGGSPRELGEIVTSSLPITNPIYHLADGSQLSSVDYPELFSYISSIYSPTEQWGESEYISNLGSRNWQAIEYFNSQFIAISYTGYISTSQDGKNWTPAQQNANLGQNSWVTIVNSSNMLLAISGNRYISTSTDGINWSQAVRIDTLSEGDVSATYDGTNYVLIDGSRRAYQTSSDGLTWSNSVQSLPSGINGGFITFDGENYVIVDEDGKVYKSTNLTSWTQTAFIDKICVNINYDGSNYRIFANDSIYVSNNLTNWNLEFSTSGYNYVDIAISGDNGTILDTGGNIITKIELPNVPFTTEAEWQTTYSTYGECGKYVYNPQANTLRLPLYNSYLTNTTNPDNLGDLTPASIPNIKGVLPASENVYKSGTPQPDYGVFQLNTANVVSGESSNTKFDNDLWDMDASRVSDVYSNSATTVNTQSIKQLVYIVVAK